MKGMGQIVSWSVRDESLHCEAIIKLYHAFNAETGAVTKSVADDIVDCCKHRGRPWRTASSTSPSRWARSTA
jgi:ribonucleoside-diphosphate reductase beta chain